MQFSTLYRGAIPRAAKLLAVLAIAWWIAASPRPGFAAALTAWDMNARLGTGINVGNALDAPDGEGTWWHGRIRPEYFDDFRAAGFRHVRLPVTWANHQQATAPYTVDPAFLDRVTQVIGWANQRGLIVVLNTMHEGWFKDDPRGSMPRFEALWRQLSERFQGVPDSLLVFEVLNESDAKHIDGALTNEMNDRILRAIRGTNPTRCVLIGAVGDNADRLVTEVRVPHDPYVIATYHCYDPWFFVSAQPRTPAEALWGSDAQKVTYLRTMDAIKRWSDGNHVPVYLGEWGTSGRCDANSRRTYYGFVSAQARVRGFSQAIWDDGGDMRIYNREARQWTTDVLDAVFPGGRQ
jgi:endoglucanase